MTQRQHLARSHIRDRVTGEKSIRVQPGQYYVTDHANAMIVTVLGSCVAACIRNPRTGFGGMNHFMLPESEGGDWAGLSAQMRYGNYAMETLINEVLKSGCRREDLEIKLLGGANMFDGAGTVGTQNATFAKEYLRQEGLTAAAVDLGGVQGRRVHYWPTTGRVKRLLLAGTQARTIAVEEKSYRSHLVASDAATGNIEWFE